MEAARIIVRIDQIGVRGALDALHQYASQCGIDKTSLFDLHLILDEILSNIDRHGFENTPAGKRFVELSMLLRNGTFYFRIEDNGLPFDPLQVQRPPLEAPVENRSVGGLGIHLVRAKADRIHYERLDEKNILLIEKRVSI
jgi:anti-sigma regulatory factor (Ser/Thr protein kinase)